MRISELCTVPLLLGLVILPSETAQIGEYIDSNPPLESLRLGVHFLSLEKKRREHPPPKIIPSRGGSKNFIEFGLNFNHVVLPIFGTQVVESRAKTGMKTTTMTAAKMKHGFMSGNSRIQTPPLTMEDIGRASIVDRTSV